jgi:hypothetical protein
MAGPIRSAFVNIAKNAAASTAQKMVSGVAGSLRSGLGGSSSSSASSPLQTNFAPKETLLLYPSDVGTNMHQASYILFARHSVSGAKVRPPKTPPKVADVMRQESTEFGNITIIDPAATRKKQQESDKNFYAKEEDKAGNQAGRGGAGAGGSTRSLTLQSRNIQRTGTAIGLYMPPAVNVQYNMDYSEGEIGVMGEALYGLFKELSKRNTWMGLI